MEATLKELAKEIITPKFAAIKTSCITALSALQSNDAGHSIEVWHLRQLCLEPLQMALESQARKLSYYSLVGLKHILNDERFHSNLETEEHEKWMAVQVLDTLIVGPHLSEDALVDIIKLLLQMTTRATGWIMTVEIVMRVSSVYIEFFRNNGANVKCHVKSAMMEMLNTFLEILFKLEDTMIEDGNNVLVDFRAPVKIIASLEDVVNVVVKLLVFLIDQLEKAQSVANCRHLLPLLLESIQTVLSSLPSAVQINRYFQDVVWERLSPALILLFGVPKLEKGICVQPFLSHDAASVKTSPTIARSSANIGPLVKVIFRIAAELVRLVGAVRSLRPVLESLFYHVLTCCTPQHRLEAMCVIEELLAKHERLVDMALSADCGRSTKMEVDLSLIKMFMSVILEFCCDADPTARLMSVTCVNCLLGSLAQISAGRAVIDSTADDVAAACIRTGLIEEDGDIRSCPDHIYSGQDDGDDGSIVVKDAIASCKQLIGSSGDCDAFVKHESTGDNVTEATCMESFAYNETESDQLVQENVDAFVCSLRNCTVGLSSMATVTDVDLAIQEFASNFCTAMHRRQANVCLKGQGYCLVLNADGIYTASICALRLSYLLSKSCFHSSKRQCQPCMSQEMFVDSVLGSGLLLYLPTTWLHKLYHHVLDTPLMGIANLDTSQSPLVCLLDDLGGYFSHQKHGHLMHKVHDSLLMDAVTSASRASMDAGAKLARVILISFWDDILRILSTPLEVHSEAGVSVSLSLLLGMETAKEESQRSRDVICMSLDGLQTASSLCCMLGERSRCCGAFALLANASCGPDGSGNGCDNRKGSLRFSLFRQKLRLVNLHASHVLGMDLMVTMGLVVGDYSPDCWKHIFRCCAHISELEHTYFSRANHQLHLPTILPTDIGSFRRHSELDDGNMQKDPVLVSTPAVHVPLKINVSKMVRQSCVACGWDMSLMGRNVLTPRCAAQSLCGLSQEVDSFFKDAALSLSLESLLNFVAELGKASVLQLKNLVPCSSTTSAIIGSELSSAVEGTVGVDAGSMPTNALYLYRLQQTLLTSVGSNRPLLHLLRLWTSSNSSLVQAAGHWDSSISKMAVTCMHDFIVAVLIGRDELPHFHVNEFLCKTFQDVLCLEMCNSDIQDQIVCSICEIVEACPQKLQSGWRPLFGALKNVCLGFTADHAVNEAHRKHVEAVLDVFEVFLNTDNLTVFADASVDCILCLLKYINGPGMFQELDSDDGSDSNSDTALTIPKPSDLCVPALGYLERCCAILASMWKMPACPVFKGAFRTHLTSHLCCVDPYIPHMDFATSFDAPCKLPPTDKPSNPHSSSCTNSPTMHRNSENSGRSTLLDIDKQSGVLNVWYMLLDGLAVTALSCHRSSNQLETLTTLFQLLRSAADVPGIVFALHCVNHLLLPMLQCWLRKWSSMHAYLDTGVIHLKQCYGLTAELVVEFVVRFADEIQEAASLEFMLRQMFVVLIECISQPVESISLLGCSCIRHLILSAGPAMTGAMWDICVCGLSNAVSVSTCNIRRVMSIFHPDSDNFYGDIAQVKVATRKNCVAVDTMRLRQLAQQVFLLESQMTEVPRVQFNLEEDKSFVFLVYSCCTDGPNTAHIQYRVPLRDVVIGLLANQLLLQTVSSVLLDTEVDPGRSLNEASLPGMLRHMSTRHVMSVIDILDDMYRLAVGFDRRPGLKFLLQKASGLPAAANQYRMVVASAVLTVHTLVSISSGYARLHPGDIPRCASTAAAAEFSDVVLRGSVDGVVNGVCRTNRLAGEGRSVTGHGSVIAGSDVAVIGNPSGLEHDEGSRGSPQFSSAIHGSRMPDWKLADLCAAHLAPDVFLPMLRDKCQAVCAMYVDIVAGCHDESLVDQMSDSPLFFLLAQPEDISDITWPLRPNSSDVGLQAEDVDCLSCCPNSTAENSHGGDVSSQVQPSSPDSVELESVEGDDVDASCRPQLDAQKGYQSKVYSVATDSVIQNLIGQYRRHKLQYAMPNRPCRSTCRGEGKEPQSVDPDIARQQSSSIMKDGEALRRSWSQIVVSVLEFFLGLPDTEFQALLPVISPSIGQLVCHAHDSMLRETLAHWFQRLGMVYHFLPDNPEL